MAGIAWTPQQARAWLEGIHYRGMHLGMERVETLAGRLGNPEQAFPSILIAGTNGKGTVAALLSSILACAGLRVGCYTSPHLVDWTERIAVGGEPIGEMDFAAALQAVATDADHLQATPFEALTMAAFWHFRRACLDWGVIEVGLGGRLDATRLCRAPITVVTAIGVDHTAELGTDLEGIAREKGSIMREAAPAVLGPGTTPVRSVLEAHAAEVGARPVFSQEWVDLAGEPDRQWGMVGTAVWTGTAARPSLLRGESECFDWAMPLAGRHMLNNLTTALAVVACLREQAVSVPTGAIVEGVRSVCWPGRLQHIPAPEGSADLVLDVGHNPLAARTIAGEIPLRAQGRRLHLVLALAADKDLDGFLRPLIGWAEAVIATGWSGDRARPPEEIAIRARRLAEQLHSPLHVETVPDPVEAVGRATSGLDSDGLVVVTGSHMLVGPVLDALGYQRERSRLWPEMTLSTSWAGFYE